MNVIALLVVCSVAFAVGYGGLSAVEIAVVVTGVLATVVAVCAITDEGEDDSK